MTDARVRITAVDESGAAFNSVKRSFDGLDQRAGMSAKAVAAAMRGVPAQFTDIVTSIQGGQKPLTVLLQQGGQLKDMFGGVAPAAKALGGYLFSMINPMTLAAGAAAVLAIAWQQGAAESRELNKQLSLTGGYAGMSSSQLMTMAAAMAQVSGTRAQATETLAALVASGKVSGDVMQAVGQAINEMVRATDTPLKDLVQRFASLADDPVKASAALNRELHYLTQSVYEQIRALEEQGKHQEAVNLAQATYAKAAAQSAKEITANLGYLETAWKGVADAAKWAWDKMLGVGRDKSIDEQLDEVSKRIESARRSNNGFAQLQMQGDLQLQANLQEMRRMNARLAENKGARARDEQEAVTATDAVAKLQEQAKGYSAVNRELQKYHDNLARIKAVNPNSPLLASKNVAAGEKAIRDQFTGSEDTLDAKLRAMKARMEELDRSLKLSLETNKANFEQGLIGTHEYLDREFELRNNSLQQQLDIAKQQEQIARGKKNVAAAEQYKAEIKKITDEINANFQQHANASVTYAAKVERAITAYTRSLNEAVRTRGLDISDSLAGADLGPNAKEALVRMQQVRRDYDKRKADLDADLAKGEGAGGIGRKQYDAQLADLQTFYAQRIGQEQDYTAKSQALRDDWNTGAKKAFNEYVESATDAAAAGYKVWSDVFQGMESFLEEFARTGKLNFRSLANSIIGDLIRVDAKAATLQAAKFFAGGGSGGFLGSLVGAAGAFLGGGGAGGVYGPDNIDVGGGWSPARHSGGVVGAPAGQARWVPSGTFAGARKYHTGGIAGDEVPTILKRGEGVFTPEQMKAMGGGRGSLIFKPTVQVTVDSRSDRGQVIADVQSVVTANNKQFYAMLQQQGVVA